MLLKPDAKKPPEGGSVAILMSPALVKPNQGQFRGVGA